MPPAATGRAGGRQRARLQPDTDRRPCHRVLPSGGGLGGYGGGLDNKVLLLKLEGAIRPADDLRTCALEGHSLGP